MNAIGKCHSAQMIDYCRFLIPFQVYRSESISQRQLFDSTHFIYCLFSTIIICDFCVWFFFLLFLNIVQFLNWLKNSLCLFSFVLFMETKWFSFKNRFTFNKNCIHLYLNGTTHILVLWKDYSCHSMFVYFFL